MWNDTAQNRVHERWFRPSDVTIGTDGALYIADWYDPVVGGHQMQDSLGYGRIYRVAPKNKRLVNPVIDLNTTAGQLLALKSPAINVRNQGFERLRQLGEAAVTIVKPLLADGNPYIRARAVWLLAQLGVTGIAEVDKLLTAPDEQLRATAYRALRQTVPDILPYAQKMAVDTSAFVRREVAVSMRDLPFSRAKPILLSLLKGYDGRDRWYLETLGAALDDHATEMYPELVQLFGEGKPAFAWSPQMANLAWRLHPPEAASHLAARAGAATLSPEARSHALTALAFIQNKAAANAMVALSKSNLQDVSAQAAYWLSFRQSNDWHALLDWSKIPLNTAYERKLAQMKVKMQVVLDGQQSLNERQWRAAEMARDSVGGQMLIGMAQENRLPEVLHGYVAEKIFGNPDATVRMQASNYFKRPGANQTMAVQQVLQLPVNATAGKQVFTSRCASCHKVGSEGKNIGPDLTAIGKKFGPNELLDAIINPSAAIVFGYEPWLVNTKDGASIYGFLVSENKQTIVVKDIAGQKHVIDVPQITSRKKQENSLMPDPIANGMTEQNLADVVGYLRMVPGKKSER